MRIIPVEFIEDSCKKVDSAGTLDLLPEGKSCTFEKVTTPDQEEANESPELEEVNESPELQEPNESPELQEPKLDEADAVMTESYQQDYASEYSGWGFSLRLSR
jgi:hypothetical protein